MNREGVLAGLLFIRDFDGPEKGLKLVRQASFSRENFKVGLPELVLSGGGGWPGEGCSN
jgi:hypothetical protein